MNQGGKPPLTTRQGLASFLLVAAPEGSLFRDFMKKASVLKWLAVVVTSITLTACGDARKEDFVGSWLSNK